MQPYLYSDIKFIVGWRLADFDEIQDHTVIYHLQCNVHSRQHKTQIDNEYVWMNYWFCSVIKMFDQQRLINSFHFVVYRSHNLSNTYYMYI